MPSDQPTPATLNLGDLRRTTPVDAGFGGGRGKPIDRHYIERFLADHAADVHGSVLEVAEDHYTRRFGGSRVQRSETLHADANANATRSADLADAASAAALPGDFYDCFICTQTLQYIYRPEAAAATIHRILRPGGVLLLTAPGISQISPYDRERWGEYWRFTVQSMQRLLASAFDPALLQVQAHGNVLSAIGFLHGLACGDLRDAELDVFDDRYPLVITARAQKAE